MDDIRLRPCPSVGEGMLDGHHECFSGDYIRGYTKAIMDVKEIFHYIQEDMKAHNLRTLSFKNADQLMGVVLESRRGIREGDGGFVRWNGASKKFEYFRRLDGDGGCA